MVSQAMAVPNQYVVEEEVTKPSNEPRGGWILFWLMLGLAIALDILGFFVLLIDLGGLGIAATVIGAPVGAALDFLTEVLSFVITWAIEFTFMLYFSYIGGNVGTRIIINSVGGIVESIPFISVLPVATVTFVIAFLVGRTENKVNLSSVIKIGKTVAKFV